MLSELSKSVCTWVAYSNSSNRYIDFDKWYADVEDLNQRVLKGYLLYTEGKAPNYYASFLKNKSSFIEIEFRRRKLMNSVDEVVRGKRIHKKANLKKVTIQDLCLFLDNLSERKYLEMAMLSNWYFPLESLVLDLRSAELKGSQTKETISILEYNLNAISEQKMKLAFEQ